MIDGVSNSRQVMNSSGCEELQLPAVRALTDKHGVQNTLLRTLHTIIKMKDALDASTIRKREIQKNEQDGATSSKASIAVGFSFLDQSLINNVKLLV